MIQNINFNVNSGQSKKQLVLQRQAISLLDVDPMLGLGDIMVWINQHYLQGEDIRVIYPKHWHISPP
jgi:hypothetical protein